MQMVSGMDEIHIDMGNLLLILYTIGVRILQRTAQEFTFLGHYGTGSIPF